MCQNVLKKSSILYGFTVFEGWNLYISPGKCYSLIKSYFDVYSLHIYYITV